MIDPVPVPTYQKPRRAGCSDLLYHILVTKMSAGATADSKHPSNVLRAARAAQFFAAEFNVTTDP